MASISPEQFLRISNLLAEPLLLVTRAGVILAANRALGNLLDVPSANLFGHSLHELLADTEPQLRAFLRACAEVRDPIPGSLSLRCGSERIVPCWAEGALLAPESDEGPALLQIRLLPQATAPDQPRLALLTARIEQLMQEIVSHRRSEQSLEAQRRWLEVTLSSIGDAVIATDWQGRVTLMNPVAERLTGWTEDEARGHLCREIFRISNEDTGEIVESPVDRVLREGVTVGLANHTVLTARDGTIRPIDDSGAPIRDEGGKPQGAVLVFRDITERKRQEKLRSFLLALDATIRPLSDPDQVLWETVLALGRHLQAARCAFSEVDDELGTLTVHRDYCDGVASHTGTFPLDVFGPELRNVLAAGETLIIPDLRSDPRTAPFYESAYAPMEVTSALAVPMLKDGRLVALLAAHGKGPRLWTGEEIVLIETVLERTWLSLENARLFRLAREELTERKEAEARLRSVLDNMPALSFVKNLEGAYLLINRAFEERTGITPHRAWGMSDFDLFPDAVARAATTRDAEVLARGEPIQYEETRLDGGRSYSYLTSRFPLRDLSGEVYAICGISTDITLRKQEEFTRQFLTRASEILASSLDYHQTLQRVADLVVPQIADWCAVDMLGEGDSIDVLAVAHRDPQRRQLGLQLRLEYPPRPEARRGLAQVLRTGQSEVHPYISDEMLAAGAQSPEHLELLRRFQFRSVMMVPIVARQRILGAITFANTADSGHLFTSDDLLLAEGLAARAALAIDNARLYQAAQDELVERRRTQDALRVSEERFRLALANSGITVYTQDSALRYTWVYSGNLGAEETHLYGRTDADLMEGRPGNDAQVLMEIKQRVLATGTEERHVVHVLGADGVVRYFDTLFAPLRDDRGVIVGVTGAGSDVSERVRAHEALAAHQAEIEALNARLQRSMRETHHRVKNNLQVITALINMQQMLYHDALPVSELERLTQHIRALASIHDLLTHQAQVDAEVSDVSVGEVVQKLLPMLQGIVPDRPLVAKVDDLRVPVRQSTAIVVLINELVSNAIKHGAGEIGLRFGIDGQTARLEISDRGPGFPEGFDADRTARTGLDLINSLARMDLGGQVIYDSRPEGGARVIVTFPVPNLVRTVGEQ